MSYSLSVSRNIYSRPYSFRLVFLVLLAIWFQAEAVNHLNVPATVEITAGSFISGSNNEEREKAYEMDEAAYGSTITRELGWYDTELVREAQYANSYYMTTTPITNSQYATFVKDTGWPVPDVDQAAWESYRLKYPYNSTRRFAWMNDNPRKAREGHPVVLVDLDDAKAYAAWLSCRTNQNWHLPTELQWEKAMRGSDGRYFPWGNEFNNQKLNSADAGPFDTQAVGRYLQGASVYGVLDGAGQVYEWTETTEGMGRSIVKGGSWDDKGCGVCRPAARHSRPNNLKHILIGFRLVREVSTNKNQLNC